MQDILDQSDVWKFVFCYMQETLNKRLYAIYEKPKPHFKKFLKLMLKWNRNVFSLFYR